MAGTKVVYIAGPITGVHQYWKAFEKAEEQIIGLGCIAITPSRLPAGMTNAQYMRLSFAAIDSADAVLFLPGWSHSRGARLERAYCRYTGKPAVAMQGYRLDGEPYLDYLAAVLGLPRRKEDPDT